MKKTIITGSLLALATVFSLLSSCDKVDAPYVIQGNQDTSACPAPDFPAVTAHYKRAFLEDYTGHNCPNCPRAGLTARDLKEHYQDSLIVVTVHAGFFAKTSTSDPLWAYDFRTPAGTEWDNFFKVGMVGNPNGMVSRKGYPANQQVMSPSLWAAAVQSTVAESSLMDLQLIAEYSASDDKLCIHTKTSFPKPISGRNLNLGVIITEDSIVQPQKNSEAAVGPTPQIMDYVHMHVMRGAVNGTWGTPILSSTETSDKPVIKTFPTHFTGFNLNVMNPAHCRVVAYIYDVDTKEVLQATECEVVE
jgi:hypothetical protein